MNHKRIDSSKILSKYSDFCNFLSQLLPEEVAFDFVVGSLDASCRLPVLSPESLIS